MSQKGKNIHERLIKAKKIATYSRVSSKDQEHLRQNEIISQFLKNIKGINDVEIQNFEDTKSASKQPFSNRDDFRDLLEEVQEKNIDAIVVSDYDRLSRQPREHDILRKLFKKLDIPVVIASKNESYTSDDIIRNIIEAGLSKLETDNMSTRIRHALKQKMENGKWRGGKVPFGFVVNEDYGEKVLVLDETKKEIVKEIFDSYSTSGTFNSIAKDLNKKYGGNEWNANKVKYIITNPVYKGVYSYHRFPNQGGYAFKDRSDWKELENAHVITEALIDNEQWERCWKKYNTLKISAPKHMNTSFYFKGILKCNCSICNGMPFTTKDQRSKGRGDRWYISVCKRGRIKAKELDDEFNKYWSWLKNKSEALFQEEVKTLLIDEFELVKNEKRDKETILVEKKELLEKIKLEIHQVIGDHDLGLEEFVEYENEVLIALIVMQNELEQQINQLMKETEKLAFMLKKLELIMEEKGGKSLGKTILLKKNFEDKQLSHADKRFIVLMAVKECNFVIDEGENGKIEFTFRTPFKNYLLN